MNLHPERSKKNMKKRRILLCVTGMMLLVGCNSNEGDTAVNSAGSSEAAIEESSEKDVATAFLDYMGKDELAQWRGYYAVGDGKAGELSKNELMEADELAAGWGEIPYEDILQSIEVYLQREGYETVSAQQVAEYLDELNRQQGLDETIYDNISFIASRLVENSTQSLEAVSSEQWQMLNQTQKTAVAAQLLAESSMYPDFLLTRFDMEDIPPGILVDVVDNYVETYGTSYLPNVINRMEHFLRDVLNTPDNMQTLLNHLSNGFNTEDAYILNAIYTGDGKYSNGFNEELLQYQSFEMNFEVVETIKINPFQEIYYGVVDMTYSYMVDNDMLEAYEIENNEAYPDDHLFNGGEDVADKTARTLVVMKKKYRYRIRL